MMGALDQLLKSIELEKSQAPETFIRIEDKYLIPNALSEQFKELLSQHLDPTYANAETEFTLVESIYFDSESLDFFQHHFSQLEQRFKVRVRRYAPNGIWENGPAFLEAKCKVRVSGQQSISSKKRFRLDPVNLQQMLFGGGIVMNDRLESMNAKMYHEDLESRVHFVNTLIENFALSPQLRIQYERMAFERNGFRVTMDKNIKFKEMQQVSDEVADGLRLQNLWATATGMNELYSNNDYFVAEVKYSEGTPLWIQEFFAQHSIQKVSFSKYCWGITNIIDRLEDTLH